MKYKNSSNIHCITLFTASRRMKHKWMYWINQAIHNNQDKIKSVRSLDYKILYISGTNIYFLY